MAGIPTVYERIANVIGSLDSYTYVTFLRAKDGWGGDEAVGIVRDLPRHSGESRRVTMTSGSEFFVDPETLESARFAGLKVKIEGQDFILIDN